MTDPTAPRSSDLPGAAETTTPAPTGAAPAARPTLRDVAAALAQPPPPATHCGPGLDEWVAAWEARKTAWQWWHVLVTPEAVADLEARLGAAEAERDEARSVLLSAHRVQSQVEADLRAEVARLRAALEVAEDHLPWYTLRRVRAVMGGGDE